MFVVVVVVVFVVVVFVVKNVSPVRYYKSYDVREIHSFRCDVFNILVCIPTHCT